MVYDILHEEAALLLLLLAFAFVVFAAGYHEPPSQLVQRVLAGRKPKLPLWLHSLTPALAFTPLFRFAQFSTLQIPLKLSMEVASLILAY